MINIADQLHAATADGVLANASEIKDGTKTQSQINAEMQAALAQAGNTEKIQQIVDTARNDVLGLVVKNCGEDIPGAILGDIYQDINGDGEFLGDFSKMVPPSDFGVGSVVKAADMQDSQEAMFYVAKTAASPSIEYDGENYSVEGVTEWLEVEKGKIYECTARKAISYTPEGEDAITGYLYLYDEVKVSLKDIRDAIEEIRSAIPQECSESGSTEIDEDEIDAIINGVDTAAPYITFYSEAEGETETAYRYTEGDVSAGESELGVSHTCFSRVDGQRFYLRDGVWVDANGNASASYTGNIDVYASLTAESPIGTAEPHGFTF